MININKAKEIINKIEIEEKISREDALTLLSSFEYDNNINIKNLNDEEKEEVKKLKEYLRVKAREKADKIFGKYVFMRGLIEFTNYCKNDCIYCGIRKSNKNAERYRLDKEDILSCCELGYEIGFRTFVLQGGEDPYYNALQLKYAYAITGHKSQGGQWRCVFIDNMLWNAPSIDDLKWLYTALTRAVEKVYLVNFPEEYLEQA